MGAGFGAYVAALYGLEAVIFDNMQFELAAERAAAGLTANFSNYPYVADENGNFQTVGTGASVWLGLSLAFLTPIPIPAILTPVENEEITQHIYNGLDPWNIDLGKIKHIYLPASGIADNILSRIRDIGGAVVGNQNIDDEYELTLPDDVPTGWSLYNKIGERHDNTLIVITMFSEQNITSDDWKTVAKHIIPALFDDNIAEAIGENLIEEYKGDRGNPNSTFRSAIAYSALDEGGLVFGNTGIRAMFNDANELGLVASGEDNSNLFSDTDANIYKYLSNIIVEFAGLEALQKTDTNLIEEKNPDSTDYFATRGVLDVGSIDDNILRIDLTDFAWSDQGFLPEAIDIINRESLFNNVLESTFKIGPIGSHTHTLQHLTNFLQLKPEVVNMWGNIDSSIFDTLYMRTDKDASKKDIYLPDYIEDERAAWEQVNGSDKGVGVYVSNEDNEKITGTSSRDLIIIDALNTEGNITTKAGEDFVLWSRHPVNPGIDPMTTGSVEINLGLDNDYFSGSEGSDTIVSKAAEWGLEPDNGVLAAVLKGDGDDIYLGTAETEDADINFDFEKWYEENRFGVLASGSVRDLVRYQQSDLGYYDPNNTSYSQVPEVNKLGVKVTQLKESTHGFHALDVTVEDLRSGKDTGADILNRIHVIELSRNPDEFGITELMLDVPILVDMGDSRRTQNEIDAFNETLLDGQTPLELEPTKEKAFLNNVDIADYSALTIGLNFYYGETSEREQGILHSGSTIHNIGAPWLGEVALATGIGSDAHNLVVENADKIILTGNDD
ncbi:MAG: hypothetical protein GY746_10385, partial [Gammaproteobacteria bacterium]|nr:hypothetical protein [Gammaproteobacteria bacterium]